MYFEIVEFSCSSIKNGSLSLKRVEYFLDNPIHLETNKTTIVKTTPVNIFNLLSFIFLFFFYKLLIHIVMEMDEQHKI